MKQKKSLHYFKLLCTIYLLIYKASITISFSKFFRVSMYFIMYITLDIKFYSTYTKQKNKRNPTLRHIVVKLQEHQRQGEKILKAARKRTDHLQRNNRQSEQQSPSSSNGAQRRWNNVNKGGENKCLLLTQTPVCAQHSHWPNESYRAHR